MRKSACLLVMLFVVTAGSMAAGQDGETCDVTVLLVRHAQTMEADDSDPPLSTDGLSQARHLMRMLHDREIDAIYTTQYRRTIETAGPVAEHHHLEPQVLPLTDENRATYAADLSDRIRRAHCDGTVLVVGHSNTVPELASELAGEHVDELDEEDYGRVFVVVLKEGEPPQLIRARL